MSGEKGLLTQSMVALGVPTCYLGGTARGSEALRWRGWLPRVLIRVVGGCPSEGKVSRSLGLEWEGDLSVDHLGVLVWRRGVWRFE